MADTLGVGIVGMGWVSSEHFKAYQNNPHTAVRGVCSRTAAGAEAKLAEIGQTTCIDGVTVFASYEEMLASPDIQIISVCSPPSKHVDQVVAAAQAGKHICIEKPLALDLAGLRRMQQAVNDAGVKTVVCFELHWNPAFQVIQSLLDQGMVGNMFYAAAAYRHGIGPWYKQWAWNVTPQEGGDSFLSAGCHALDAAMHFVGSEVTAVSAFSNTSPDNPLQYQYDPNITANLKFANGVIGNVYSSIEYVGPYWFPISIDGDLGHIRNNQLWSKKIQGQTELATIPTILPDSGDVTHHPYQGEMDDFVDCILNGGTSHLELNVAAKVFEVIFAAQESVKTGRTIQMAEFLAQ